MTYDQAIANVRNGQYSWRATWGGGEYLHLFDNQVFIYRNGIGAPYTPTGGDAGATDWDSGDHPPK